MKPHPPKKILILGATSAIAEACARLWAVEGASFLLAGRRSAKLEAIAADLKVRGAPSCWTHTIDFTDANRHAAVFDIAQGALGIIDLILIAHGALADQKACETCAEAAAAVIAINGTSVIELATRAANLLETQGHGTLAVIGSVAGDRGRQSNYVYSAAKSMVACFCQGLRSRLAKKGVRVLTIKPGLTDTPMTAAMPKGGPLWASPEQIARGIERAVYKNKDVVYLPGFWRFIMLVARSIPEGIFKRLSL